mgnify:CR=1 FL=1
MKSNQKKALHMKGEYLAALEKYDKAIELSPKAPLFRFKRAKTLVSCERLEVFLSSFFVHFRFHFIELFLFSFLKFQ